MAKFRKKPVEIEAVRWFGGRTSEAPDWFAKALLTEANVLGSVYRYRDCLMVRSLEGTMTAQPGDWIVRGVKGELYPCKPDIFAMTYEAVEDV